MTASLAFAVSHPTGFPGYYGYWRFSELRSMPCATSDRSAIGGNVLTPESTRC